MIEGASRMEERQKTQRKMRYEILDDTAVPALENKKVCLELTDPLEAFWLGKACEAHDLKNIWIMHSIDHAKVMPWSESISKCIEILKERFPDIVCHKEQIEER